VPGKILVDHEPPLLDGMSEMTFVDMPHSKPPKGNKDIFLFVNIDSPDQLKTREKQRLVHQHVGKFHRNRSRPAQRANLEDNFDNSSTSFASIDASSSKPHSHINLENDVQRSSLSQRDGGAGKQSRTQRDLKLPLCKNNHNQRPDLNVLSTRSQRRDEIDVCGRRLRDDGLMNEIGQGSNGDLEALRNDWKCSVVNHLSQSRRDPFAHYPVDDPDDQVLMLVDHGIALD